jgi:hypothetical protein
VKAHKSYFFFDTFALMMGSGIERVHPGQGRPIVTTIEQAAMMSDISYSLDGDKPKRLSRKKDHNLELNFNNIAWFHQGKTGYVIWSSGIKDSTSTVLRAGSFISDSDSGRSGNEALFHLAILHGTDPDPLTENYAYAVVPNVNAGAMSLVAKDLQASLDYKITAGKVHAVADAETSTIQAVFLEPGTLSIGGDKLRVDKSAMVLLKETGNALEIAVSDPEHDLSKSEILLELSQNLSEGAYRYLTVGVDPVVGESVIVRKGIKGAVLRFEMPDLSDVDLYQNRHEMYSGMPVYVTIPINR